jgi:DNA-binding winged helix-turn-helix (wHTH) protein/tetratricopeptide (TPR) repeat protein
VIDPSTYRFDGWTLQVETGELEREGQSQRLTQQPLRILLELLRQPGKVVSRERLVEVLWPKGVVDYDNGLNVAMRKLRLTLGDESETPRYIETVPRLGYRFIGKLEADPGATDVAPPVVTAPKRHPHWLFAGGIAGGAILVVLWVLSTLKSEVPPGRESPGAEPAAEPEASPPVVARRTTSVRAYEHYLQGIYHRSRRDVDAGQKAIASFEASLREDPEYAEAWAGLSDTYVGAAIGHSIPATKAFALARDAARRAVQLDPGIAETHTSLGQIYMFYERDYPAAERQFALARAANEKYARLWHHLAMLRAFQGRSEEALAAIRRARELEPMTLLYNSNHALVLYHSRRYDEAIAHARGLLEAQPQLHQVRSVLIRSLIEKDELVSALEQLPLRGRDTPNLSDAALVYARKGMREEALAEIARIEKVSAQGFGVGYELAIAHAALGNLDAACRALDLAWRDSSPFLGWMRLDPRMDPLRKQPCYADVEKRLHGPKG